MTEQIAAISTAKNTRFTSSIKNIAGTIKSVNIKEKDPASSHGRAFKASKRRPGQIGAPDREKEIDQTS